MIVSCEHCETQFRLDDSKVPESGARVRCSKCNHAFFIPPPGHSDDLMAAERAREARQAARRSDDDVDSDWEFNHDSPAEAAEPAAHRDAARQAVDGLLGELGGGPSEEPEPEAEAPSEEAPGEDAPEPAAALEAEPEAAEAPIESQVEARAEVFEMPAQPEEADLGGPETWDLLDDGGEGQQASIGQVASVPRWQLLERERAAALQEDLEATGLSRALRGAIHATGWLVTLALLSAGAWGALQPAAPLAAGTAGRLAVEGYRALEVHGRWMENAVAGPIYVVSGRLRRSGGAAPAPLAVRLLDSQGAPLAARSTPLGPPFSDQQLREVDPVQLRDSQRRAAPEFARLHPGETVPFEAVFSRVPDEAARFDLERREPARR